MPLSGMRLLLGIIALLMLADFVFRRFGPATTAGNTDFTEPDVGVWSFGTAKTIATSRFRRERQPESHSPNIPIAVV